MNTQNDLADAAGILRAHGHIALSERLLAMAEQPAQQNSAWCMKTNGCKTKCEDCPDEPAPAQEPQPPYEFERYVAGSLRAQGVRVERATTLADAMRIAARICPPANPPSAPTVLIYTTPPAPAQPLTQDMVESCPYDAETLRGAYFDGWLKAEAAHGITKGNI